MTDYGNGLTDQTPVDVYLSTTPGKSHNYFNVCIIDWTDTAIVVETGSTRVWIPLSAVVAIEYNKPDDI